MFIYWGMKSFLCMLNWMADWFWRVIPWALYFFYNSSIIRNDFYSFLYNWTFYSFTLSNFRLNVNDSSLKSVTLDSDKCSNILSKVVAYTRLFWFILIVVTWVKFGFIIVWFFLAIDELILISSISAVSNLILSFKFKFYLSKFWHFLPNTSSLFVVKTA